MSNEKKDFGDMSKDEQIEYVKGELEDIGKKCVKFKFSFMAKFLVVSSFIMVILKLFNVGFIANWSWWTVTSLLWLPLVTFSVVLCLGIPFVFMLGIYFYLRNKNRYN